ncbi:MAG: MFS transporter, partial [Coriobacteriales bacterium]|nr:MFS transporter [Coriobacteriales bacterium]
MRELLRNENFRRYWLASMFSEFGVITLQFVIALYVFDLTGSAVLYGTLLAVVIIPRFILYPLVGIWVDLYDRKKMLMGSMIFALLVLVVFTAYD